MTGLFMIKKYSPRRRFFLFAALTLPLLILPAGCAGNDKTDQPGQESAGGIAEYFPIRENTKYIYEGAGNEFAGYDAYVDFTSADKIQQRVENGGTVAARVYEIKDGKLALIFSKGEAYFRENLLDQKGKSEEIMLMEPLARGTAWTLADGGKRSITGTDKEIATPMGTYACIEVTTANADGSTTAQYYAKDVGLVKYIFRSGGAEVSSTLKSVEKDAAGTQTVRLYFPDVKNDRIYYGDREIAYHTNDSTEKILETAFANAINEAFGIALSDGTLINSITREDDNIVRIDFNTAFAADMNAVSGYEGVILQCIADTLGYYYNSESVSLTVGGKPYRSEHISMTEGQTIPVKLEEITEKNLSEIY